MHLWHINGTLKLLNKGVITMDTKKNELYHHGIKGQKWGVRRYQNSDGSLTAEGKKSSYSARAQRKDAKKRQYYLKNTEAQSKWWKSEVDRNIKSRNEMKKMSDKELFDNIDDDELIVMGMGMDKKSYQDLLLKEADYYIKQSRDAAKAWTDAHNEIMNAPLGKYTKNKHYREVINRNLNANNN